MTLTPSTVRLDLKCGKGSISEGEKCHKGPATRVKPASPARKEPAGKVTTNKSNQFQLKKRYVALAAYGALTAVGLYQLRNVRKAYSEKFDPAQRYTPFKDTIGDPMGIMLNSKASKREAAQSMFGDVTFATHEGRNIVIKTMGRKGLAGEFAVDGMKAQGIISADTAKALKRAQGNLQVNEVQAAQLAGAHGFGPKLVAAGNNRLITEVAQGRPLISQTAMWREAPKVLQQLARDPGAGLKKLAALRWRSVTQNKTGISDLNKRRIIDNLGRMHSVGIAHNDLHPGNIFVSHKGAQFIDFGTSERGGGAVAAEFVRMMNPPRIGLSDAQGMGYNLRSIDPKSYSSAEKGIRKAIGKRIGPLASADIHKALSKSSNRAGLEAELQRIVDAFYTQYSRRPRTDAARLDSPGRACGQSFIAAGKTCRQKGAFPTGKAIAAGLTAGAVGAALLHKGSRKAILGAPGAARRTAQRAVTEVVHRATAKPPSMRLTPKAFEQIKPTSKTQRLHRAAQQANVTAERAMRKAAQAEVERGIAVGNAMYAAGKATRASLRSGLRTHNLTVEKLRRRYEPGYRKPRRDNYIQYYAPVQLQPPTRNDAAVFTNKKLHAAVKEEAKRKFKVYPSAYANAWMVQEYKSRGGTFRDDALDKWFDEKWVRMSGSGRILGPCGARTESEGKPKCLPLAKARAMSAAERRTLVARKRRHDPEKNRSGAPVMVSSKTDSPWATGFDTEDGKKYTKVVTNPETGRKNRIRYGAKGYKIAPGTDKGDRYCARSFGDMKSEGYNCSGAERNTPLCLSRAKWKCSGKTSRRDGLTPGKSSA